MKLGSFFSGIGGLELGLEAALGAETVFQCERDPYARRVLAKHWPGVPRFNDVRAFASRRWTDSHPIPHADVWCGGFPCQDISVAGKQVGIHGARSGLFFTWMRAVRIFRPRFLVLENVPAILAGDNYGPVLGALAEAGYDAEWDLLGAWQVGAPHRRDRWFLIGWDSDAERKQLRVRGRAAAAGAESEAGGEAREQRIRADACAARQGVAHADGDVRHRWSGSLQMGRSSRQAVDAGSGSFGSGDEWRTEPNVGRVAHGVPARVDRLRGLGNAVVPQCA